MFIFLIFEFCLIFFVEKLLVSFSLSLWQTCVRALITFKNKHFYLFCTSRFICAHVVVQFGAFACQLEYDQSHNYPFEQAYPEPTARLDRNAQTFIDFL